MSDVTSSLYIYGASDDLIEIEGAVQDELSPPFYGKPAVVTVKVDDTVYTRILADYDPDGTGEWRLQLTDLTRLASVVPARGEDEGDDEHGCPGYSDKVIVDMATIEARRIKVTVAKARYANDSGLTE